MSEINKLAELQEFLEGWKDDERNIKKVFLDLKGALEAKENTSFSFKARPGISYSLRASLSVVKKRKRRMFTLIDIIDDPERWFSVCFYADTITDKDELGNLIPNGIIGEDGYCFDLDKYDDYLISYVKKKIDEAYAYAIAYL